MFLHPAFDTKRILHLWLAVLEVFEETFFELVVACDPQRCTDAIDDLEMGYTVCSHSL